MVLLIGGAYQGKRHTRKKIRPAGRRYFHLRNGIAGPVRPLPPASGALRACLRPDGKEPADVLGGLDLSEKILICEDISCGVVPMDAEAREWREAVGRMNAALAAQADTVTRISVDSRWS